MDPFYKLFKKKLEGVAPSDYPVSEKSWDRFQTLQRSKENKGSKAWLLGLIGLLLLSNILTGGYSYWANNEISSLDQSNIILQKEAQQCAVTVADLQAKELKTQPPSSIHSIQSTPQQETNIASNHYKFNPYSTKSNLSNESKQRATLENSNKATTTEINTTLNAKVNLLQNEDKTDGGLFGITKQPTGTTLSTVEDAKNNYIAQGTLENLPAESSDTLKNSFANSEENTKDAAQVIQRLSDSLEVLEANTPKIIKTEQKLRIQQTRLVGFTGRYLQPIEEDFNSIYSKSYGILTLFGVLDKLSLITGLSVFKNSFELENLDQPQETKVEEFLQRLPLPDGDDPTDKLTKLEGKIYVLTVPIGLQYTFYQKEKFSTHFGAHALGRFSANYSFETYFKTQQTFPAAYEVGYSGGFYTFNLNTFQVDFGARYQVLPKWFIGLEANYLQTVFNVGVGQSLHPQLGGNIQIGYNF